MKVTNGLRLPNFLGIPSARFNVLLVEPLPLASAIVIGEIGGFMTCSAVDPRLHNRILYCNDMITIIHFTCGSF